MAALQHYWTRVVKLQIFGCTIWFGMVVNASAVRDCIVVGIASWRSGFVLSFLAALHLRIRVRDRNCTLAYRRWPLGHRLLNSSQDFAASVSNFGSPASEFESL